MKFTILGASITSKKSPSLLKVEAHLRKLPDGTLLNTNALVEAMQMSFGNFRTTCRSQIDPEFCTRSPKGNVKLYGNHKTVRAWKQQHQL